MYARGLFTRDIEYALAEATGDALLSCTLGGKVKEIFYEEFGGSSEYGSPFL